MAINEIENLSIESLIERNINIKNEAINYKKELKEKTKKMFESKNYKNTSISQFSFNIIQKTKKLPNNWKNYSFDNRIELDESFISESDDLIFEYDEFNNLYIYKRLYNINKKIYNIYECILIPIYKFSEKEIDNFIKFLSDESKRNKFNKKNIISCGIKNNNINTSKIDPVERNINIKDEAKNYKKILTKKLREKFINNETDNEMKNIIKKASIIFPTVNNLPNSWEPSFWNPSVNAIKIGSGVISEGDQFVIIRENGNLFILRFANIFIISKEKYKEEDINKFLMFLTI